MRRILTLLFAFLIPVVINTGCCIHLLPVKEAKITPKEGTGVIMIDFDGYQSKFDKWGYVYWIPSRMSREEKEMTMQYVRDYFNLWDVIVTDNENIYNAYSKRVAVRAVVTLTTLPDPDSGVLGLGYPGTVFERDSTPVVIDPSSVSFRPLNVAAIIAHEVGHALGLRHQVRVGVTRLIPDTGDMYKQPIMGYGLNVNNRQWYNGINSDYNWQSDTMWISRTWNRIK